MEGITEVHPVFEQEKNKQKLHKRILVLSIPDIVSWVAV